MIALAGIKIETVDWSTFAPLANHLWQSTIFAGTAGLLTLLLRKNRAQTRYWLWLIASAKFLIPFSLLISLGSHLGWSKPASITQPVFTVVMQQVGQPFSPSEPDLQAKPATSRPRTVPARVFLIALTTAWACGSLAILLAWCLRWRRLMLAMRPALPVDTGRELEMLRRLEKTSGTKPIDLFISDAALEPGIVGIVRPVLLLPAGISDRLTDAQLEAVMSHELCHVHRRDNMITALHMVVEAMFWFHPLVWWLGSRLVEERERACDEEVLLMGSDPQAYAQGILKVCEFYLESPLVCVAGVTGSSLKTRIEEIMMNRNIHRLELKKKLLLAVAGAAAIALPVVFGVLHALAIPRLPLRSFPAQSRAGFESISIQLNKDGTTGVGDWKASPDFFQATNETLTMLISQAYGVNDFQVSGGPSWIYSERYDVNVQFTKLEGDDRIHLSSPSQVINHRRLQLQSILADRFKLAIHRETKPAPIYELVLSASGPNFHEATSEDYGGVSPNGEPFGLGIRVLGSGDVLGRGISMAFLADWLSMNLGREVVDKTKLTGNYHFTLHCGKDTFQKPLTSASKSAAILSAMPRDLGLQLNPQVGPVKVVIVDHAEQVSAMDLPLRPLQSLPAKSLAQSRPSQLEAGSVPPHNEGPTMPPFPPGKGSSFLRFTPDSLQATNAPLPMLIGLAYDVNDFQVSGPSWIYSAKLEAINVHFPKVEGSDPIQLMNQRRLWLQSLLAHLCKLEVHRETKPAPIYELVVSASGPNFHKAAPGDTYANGVKQPWDGRPFGPGIWSAGGDEFVGQSVSMAGLAGFLSRQLGREVADKTALTGNYDFTLHWAGEGAGKSAAILAAVPHDLGLQLNPQVGPVDVIIVDHAEQDSGSH